MFLLIPSLAAMESVVEILENGTTFEVEFTDREGCTYESLGLRADQFMLLRYEATIEN